MAIPFLRITRRFLNAAILATAVLSVLSVPAAAQRGRIVIKMASLAPATSPWHDALLEMGHRWREASDGKVDLQIIPSAQGGEEDDVLRKMKIGQFQAGTFSLAGLQHLTTAVSVLAIPRLAHDQDDLHRIRTAVGPKLEEVFLEEGYVLLHWADLGWMRFFTPNADPSPEAVTSYTYVQWGDSSMDDLWNAAGFTSGVTLNMADILVGLQNGLVEAINTAPLVVGGYQWFSELPYIIDIRWAPLSGATLIDRRSWERIPADLRPVLKEIAEEIGADVRARLQEWEGDVLRAMQERAGVEIITPPPEVMEEWQRIFDRAAGMLRGGVVPEAWYDEAVRVGRAGRGG
jgi:TRAP-type C4-dicarboxylate transport system substrate-binding protein